MARAQADRLTFGIRGHGDMTATATSKGDRLPHSVGIVGAIPRRSEIGALCGALLAALIFGANFVAGRHGVLAGLTPVDLVTLRFAVAGLIFLPFLLRNGVRNLAGVGWAKGAVITLLAGAPYTFFITVGLQFAPAAHGAVLNPGLTTVAGVLLSRIILKERLAPLAALGIPAGILGLVLMAGPG